MGTKGAAAPVSSLQLAAAPAHLTTEIRMIKQYWAVLDDRGEIYGLTVYPSIHEARKALQWCIDNVGAGYRLATVKPARIGD